MALNDPPVPVIPAPIWRNFKELQEWEQLHKTRPEGDKHSPLFESVTEGIHQFGWKLNNQVWNQEPLHLVSVQVSFAVQGQNYDVQLSTLVDNSQ